MLNEIRVHWALENCPSVLSLLAIYEDQEKIYLILEYQPEGTLTDIFKNQSKLSEAEVRMIME
jgi:serine/threonine protein kinase